MYRAYLHLHPHPPPNAPQKSSSVLPGSFPKTLSTATGSSDSFTRTIDLTPDKPAQPIGRSSRNKSKGLFAARDNGFFESAVMSRAHAEVRLVLHPSRKVVIQDMKSMHGTYVNGLQLRENETAEIRDGTEVTFGSEVTRGEEVFPPKTFRCGVEWTEETPKPDDNTRSKGYGVSEDLLITDSDDEDEDDDLEDEDVTTHFPRKDHDMDIDDKESSGSSGASSSPAPSSATNSPWKATTKLVGASTSRIPYSHGFFHNPAGYEADEQDEILRRDNANVDPKTQIDNILRAASNSKSADQDLKDTSASPEVTVSTLANKSRGSDSDAEAHQSSQQKKDTRTRTPVRYLFIDDAEDSGASEDDNEIEVVSKPENFDEWAKTADQKSKKPIVIDDEEWPGDDEMQDEDCADDGERDEEGEDTSEDEEREEDKYLFGSDSSFFSGKKDEDVVQDNKGESRETLTPHKDKTSEAMYRTQSWSTSPEIMSSKKPAIPVTPTSLPHKINLGNWEEQVANALAEAEAQCTAFSIPNSSSAPTLPPLSEHKFPPITTKTTPSGAAHTHWLPEIVIKDVSPSAPPAAVLLQQAGENSNFAESSGPHQGVQLMEQKKEYFAAREQNMRENLANLAGRQTQSGGLMSPVGSELQSPAHNATASWTRKVGIEDSPGNTTGLFPKAKMPWEDNLQKTPSAKNKPPASSPPVMPRQAKTEGENNAGIWSTEAEDEDTEIREIDVNWEDDIMHEEDGEYEYDAEEELRDFNAPDMEVDSEPEQDEENEVHIPTDVSDNGSNGTSMDRLSFGDGGLVIGRHGLDPFSSTARNAPSEPSKNDFTKSRFSISNLVNKNDTPQMFNTRPVATTFYPPAPQEQQPNAWPYGQRMPPYSSQQADDTAHSSPSWANILCPRGRSDFVNSSPSGGCKRKHEEISTSATDKEQNEQKGLSTPRINKWIDETDDEAGFEEKAGETSTLQNAQPQDQEMDMGGSMQTEPGTCPIDALVPEVEGVSIDDEERPRKRLRSGSRPGFARLAASALAGAVVGSVGMFAALVATAPDSY